MTFANVSNGRATASVAEIRNRLPFVGQEHSIAHPTEHHLVSIASLPLDCLGESDRTHVLECPQCAHSYSLFRATTLLQKLPKQWQTVVSDNNERFAIEGNRFQILGRISLESLQFEASANELEWISHYSYLRVNLIIDLDFCLFSITVLDVPREIDGIQILGPTGWVQLSRTEDGETCEADIFFDPETLSNNAFIKLEQFVTFFKRARVRLRFHSSSVAASGINEIHGLLHRLGVIENESPYWLPNGLRVDTHINLGKLCRFDFAVQSVADAFTQSLRGVSFDCILCHGWPMGVIGRRLAAAWSTGGREPEIIVTIGYAPPMLMSDIGRNRKVLILVDVNVTGALVENLRQLVSNFGATVAGVRALVDGATVPSVLTPQAVLSLCRVAMHCDEGIKDCRTAAPPGDWIYNPFSTAMTKRCRASRSPSEFLDENDEVREFWKLVDQADAYSFHKKENHAHYLAFIDTLKLIQDTEVGDRVLDGLVNTIAANFVMPDVILVPGRKARAKLLGAALIQRIRDRFCTEPRLVVACRRGRRWAVDNRDIGKFAKARILVVDTAVGHGETIEELCRIAGTLQPNGVGAAVLISRLTEAGELALDHRLPDGFVSQYHVPFQPFVIRGSHEELCPVCAEKVAIEQAKSTVDSQLFEAWEKWLSRTPVSRSDNDTTVSRAQISRQLSLYPSETNDFLTWCRPKIAGAITLHSLGAAQTNGMAALAIPELQDPHLKPRTKTAMVEHLPPHVLEWSGEHLERELEQVLNSSCKPGLWRATARVMSRENRDQWYECLEEFLQRCNRLRTDPAEVFWGSMTWNAYVSSQIDPDARLRLQTTLTALLEKNAESAAHEGIKRMLKAVSCDLQS